jgi:procollagen-lysine,2-oxoglutarate 5-dioxygenase
MGEAWKGGDMNYPGGGFKVNLLKKELLEHKDKKDLVVMFTDSYDVIITAGKDDILAKFKEFDANIVFGAEPFCWPRKDLASKYPEVLYLLKL